MHIRSCVWIARNSNACTACLAATAGGCCGHLDSCGHGTGFCRCRDGRRDGTGLCRCRDGRRDRTRSSNTLTQPIDIARPPRLPIHRARRAMHIRSCVWITRNCNACIASLATTAGGCCAHLEDCGRVCGLCRCCDGRRERTRD